MTDSVGIVRTQSVTFDTELELESGRLLGPVTLAYECYGTLNTDRTNAVLVTHAWTGDAHAAGRHSEEDRKPGWWDDMIGPGKVIDTDRYFVICSNVIGSCHGSTGPTSLNPRTGKPYNLQFPVIMVRDMVKAQRLLIDHLGIDRLLSVIGGSMGAMQAIEWGTSFPDRVRSIIPIAGTGKPSPMAIAMNSVARWAIFNDPMYKKGNYRPEHPPANGLSLARGIGHISFLAYESMQGKFGRRFSARDGLFDFFGQFEIERYLEYNGSNFPSRFDTNSFLYLAKALDLFDVSWNYDSLDEALDRIGVPSLWFAFTSDWLYPPSETEELVEVLHRLGKDASYHLVESDYGHDSFLVEANKYDFRIRDFLRKIEDA